jgi:uncharacterized membrane protein YfcA
MSIWTRYRGRGARSPRALPLAPSPNALDIFDRSNIRMLVALKNFLTLCVRGVAILVLVLEDNVSRSYAVPMAIGGLVGGYVGGMVSHRANRTVVRFIVIAVGFAASAYYFWKLYGPTVVRAGAE